MAGVRCPMCGKPNPAGLENCQFCDARLIPLSASTPDASPGQGVPLGPAPTPGSDSSGDLPDWLSGLGKAVSEGEEEAPDWLASLRNEEAGKSAPASGPDPEQRALNVTGSLSFGPGGKDWMARLGSEPKSAIPETAPQGVQPGKVESLDGLNQLKDKAIDSELAPGGDDGTAARSNIPDWLSSFGSTPGTPDAVTGESVPEWLSDPGAKNGAVSAAATGESVPEWLSDPGAKKGPVSAAATGENVPEWLSDLEAKNGPASAATAPIFKRELPPSSPARDEIPDWLSQFQTDVNAAEEVEAKKDQFETAPQPPVKETGTGSLPDWLAGIKPASTPSDGTPALIATGEGNAAEEKDDAAFSMEMPDWLSKLKPEKASENISEADADTPTPEVLEVSELPSWVQAMRPVESVVDRANATPQKDAQVIEHSGPLAGLRGVLPVGPGMGSLRKPPVYSTSLHITDGQQRYAAALEQLIFSETKSQSTKKRTRLASNQLWRWFISVLLILAIVMPLITGKPVAPAGKFQIPEMESAFTFIGSLPSNAPVLVVFDYDPALSGELEAAAAPLMDHLLLQGPRLALISTSPTGPALAERFFHDTSASPLVAGHNYQPGQQYVNLGYLAGGSSGVLYFAFSPAKAAPFTLDGQQAWQLPPLQGIQKLNDFAAIIVLTDNADNGRVWIEQTSSTIGNTPILMVISAQAEPMILPYYDSGQIKGLVTGLAGGEASGQTFVGPDAQNGLAQRYWNPFGAGTLVAELLIVVGALWSAVTGWRARRNKSGEGD